MSRRTPVKRFIAAAILPLMLLGIISCATVERRVQIPQLSGKPLALRRVRVMVGLSTETQPLTVSAARPVTVYDGAQKVIKNGLTLSSAEISLSRKGAVAVGDEDWGLPAVVLVPAKGDEVSITSTTYPGYIVLVKRGDAVMVVNHVEMEDYVAGVVSSEMPRRFLRAALEAQAVAARTFALGEMRRKALDFYDVFDDQQSQVYKGTSGTYAYGRRAARRTAGVVLVYDWRFLNAFYFSTCGGHTAPAEMLPGAPRIKPFSGVECRYCKASKLYKWVKMIPVADVEEALARNGYLSGSLKDVKVVSTVDGGWVSVVEIDATGGKRRISGGVFRKLLGTSDFYSSKFEIRRNGDEFVIQGNGYGHGVGMCQWGADGMARQGKNYAEILRYYYPGADLVKIY